MRRAHGSVWGRFIRGLCVALLVLGALVPVALSADPASADAPSSPGTFVPVTPFRLLDTRTDFGGAGSIAPHGMTDVDAASALRLAPSAISAVALNVTVTRPVSFGYVTVWAHNTTRPTASNLNFTVGVTVPNMVVAPVGSDGLVSLYNGSDDGAIDLIADIAGYYLAGAPTAPGAYGAVTPTRLLDTRIMNIPVAPMSTVTVPIAGRSSVPASAGAAILNVTATQPTSFGYLTVYPDDGPLPSSSNVNFVDGQTVPNLVATPLGSDGGVTIYNGSIGTVHVIVDVFGYFAGGAPLASGAFGALSPSRLLDTRTGADVPIAPDQTIDLPVAGAGGVPASSVSSVILNVTATQPSSFGYLTVYPAGAALPDSSNVNFVDATVANLVSTPVGANGSVSIHNGSAGTVHVVVDVFGYTLASSLAVPPTSTARYVRNISGAASDASTMRAEGEADGAASSAAGQHLALLMMGAQTVNTLPNGGVLLTGGGSTRLDYPMIVTAIEGYIDGFADAWNGQGTATIGVATNSDGEFEAYPAAAKGADWATHVIAPLQAHASSKDIAIVGANDIEAGFGATEAQAEAWINAYLANAPGALLYVGSADGCPSAFGATGQTCDPVAGTEGTNTWTQHEYYQMAYGISPTRIQVVPQIYGPANAGQWANIALSGAAGMQILGSLTQHGVSCGSLCTTTPTQGWALLHQALSAATQTAALPLPLAADLRVN